MGHIFIAVNGDNVGESIGNAIISDNHDELSRVSGSIKSAHQMLDQWVQSKGGKVIVSSGDEGIYSIPQQAVNELDSIKQKYASMANTSLTIGVGSSMSEASKALIYGKMNNKDQVVHYEPAVDDYISNDGQAQAEEQAVEDELPSEQDVIDQGDASEEGQEGVDESVDDGATDGDGEEDNSAIAGEENDPNAEFSQDDEDGLDQDGELADQDEDGLVDDEEEQVAAAAQAPQQDISKNPAAPQAPGQKAAPAQAAPGKPAPKQAPAPMAQAPGEEQEDESQPSHEQGMDEEEDFAHDAEENQDDEQDSDNVEADEEEATFGEQTDEDSEEQDADGNMDAEFDPAAQDNGEVDADLSDVDDEDGMNPAADGADAEQEDDEEGFGGVGDEDDSIPELGEDEVEQSANPEESDGIMSEMLHANMGDEEAEDSDDDIKQDIIESLMQFKTQRAAIEEMKSSNPELYQANMIMLRSMIQMAKKLKMNPERGLAEKGMAQDTADTFPPAQDDQQVDPNEQNPLLGKSEDLKKARVDEGKRNGQKRIDRMNRGTRENPKSHEKGVHKPHFMAGKKTGRSEVGAFQGGGKLSPDTLAYAKEKHKQVMDESKKIKPNLPKSEMCKAKVDEGKTDNQKQVARAYRNDRVKNPETKKIVGTPKQSIAQPKAFAKKETEVKKR